MEVLGFIALGLLVVILCLLLIILLRDEFNIGGILYRFKKNKNKEGSKEESNEAKN